MRIFSILDYILIPFYVGLLSLFVRWFKNKNIDDNELAKYFLKGFRIKLFFGIAFAFFAEFILSGDTEMYYTGGIDFKNIIFNNIHNLRFILAPAKEFGDFYEANINRPENFGYVSSPGNFMAMKFVALFALFSFNSYMVISMFFAVFSFFGLWYMFKCFHKIYPSFHNPIFMAFFYIPSVLFWGSGILKDTLCIGFLGIGFYNAYLLFFEKKYRPKILLAVIISFYCLYTIKSYIAIAFIPSFLFWYILKRIASLKNKIIKIAWIVVPLLGFLLYLEFGNINKVIIDNAAESVGENMQAIQRNYKRATPDNGAIIDYGEITPTISGIAKLFPMALFTTLFRPYIWEAKKATALFAALEGTFLFCFTLFVFIKKGLLKSVIIITSDSTILFCFLFSIVFATAIGLNCFNLGTLVRYKIPCIPFYVLSLILLLKKQHKVEVQL